MTDVPEPTVVASRAVHEVGGLDELGAQRVDKAPRLAERQLPLHEVVLLGHEPPVCIRYWIKCC